MGRRDKHRSGSSRNNPVFKVVGARVGRAAKGRPRGVDVKLKKVTTYHTGSGEVWSWGSVTFVL